ncbi:unnamed protein product, partial [Cladocopium goreaui]
ACVEQWLLGPRQGLALDFASAFGSTGVKAVEALLQHLGTLHQTAPWTRHAPGKSSKSVALQGTGTLLAVCLHSSDASPEQISMEGVGIGRGTGSKVGSVQLLHLPLKFLSKRQQEEHGSPLATAWRPNAHRSHGCNKRHNASASLSRYGWIAKTLTFWFEEPINIYKPQKGCVNQQG